MIDASAGTQTSRAFARIVQFCSFLILLILTLCEFMVFAQFYSCRFCISNIFSLFLHISFINKNKGQQY